MKSSAMARLCRGLLAFDRGAVDVVPVALERDPGEDEHAARELERAQALAEQDEREEDGEERLQVREQRRARGPDAVDRREPEDVRQEERPDDGVTEAEPDLPAE